MRIKSTSSFLSILLLSSILISITAKCETLDDHDECDMDMSVMSKRHNNCINFLRSSKIKEYQSCESEIKQSQAKCNKNPPPEYGNNELNECLMKNAREQNKKDAYKDCDEIKSNTVQGTRKFHSCMSNRMKELELTRKKNDQKCKTEFSKN